MPNFIVGDFENRQQPSEKTLNPTYVFYIVLAIRFFYVKVFFHNIDCIFKFQLFLVR